MFQCVSHAARSESRRERAQRLTVIQLAFVRQQPALREARAERGFGLRDLRARELDEAAIEQIGRRIGAQPALEKRRLRAIRAVPDDERAVALEEDRLGQLGRETRPAFERRRAEADHERLRARRFGERREHRGGDPRRRLRARRIAAFVQRDV